MSNEKIYGGEFGSNLAGLKARIPFTQDMQGLGFDGDARKVGAVLMLAGVAGDLIDHIEQLTAELDAVRSMAEMLENREWAEHVGKGEVSQRLELAITNIHGELGGAAHKADLLKFIATIPFSETLEAGLDQFDDVLPDPDECQSGDEFIELMGKVLQIAKDNGLWPIQEVPA